MAEENQTDSSSVSEWLPPFWGRHSTPILQLQGGVRRMRAGGAWDFSMSRMLSPLFYPQRSGAWDQERRPFEPRKAKAQIAFTMASLPVLAPPAHTRSLPLYLLGLCACRFGGRFGSLNRKGGLRKFSTESPFPRVPSCVLSTSVHFFQGGEKLGQRKAHEQRKGSQKAQDLSGKP